MAINLPTGGRRGAVRGRTQFKLPNGRYAKVDRATGRILSVKADRKPYKGIVITDSPARLPRREGGRLNLPLLMPRPVRQAHPRASARAMEPTPFPATAAANDLAKAA